MSNINELYKTNRLNKKAVDTALSDLIMNGCYQILDPVSRYIYKNRGKTEQLKYGIVTDNIERLIKECIHGLRKAKTGEEFLVVLHVPFAYCINMLERALVINKTLDSNEKTWVIYTDLTNSAPNIYEMFYYSKVKRTTTRKKVRTKGRALCRTSKEK